MSAPLQRLALRLLYASRRLDRLFELCLRAREEWVLQMADDGFLEKYGEFAYERAASYRSQSEAWRGGLFKEEERAISACFPKPPAHLLVGAAGGGREAVSLAAMGYRVTAFEPAAELALSLQNRVLADRGLLITTRVNQTLPIVGRDWCNSRQSVGHAV